MRKRFRTRTRTAPRLPRFLRLCGGLSLFALPIVAGMVLVAPAIRTHTAAAVEGLVLNEMTGAVDEHLMETDTHDWFQSQSGASQAQLAYLDLSDVSRFQTETADEANQRIAGLAALPVRLPLGALLGWPFWLDSGPQIYARFRLQGPVHARVTVTSHTDGKEASHEVVLSMTAHVHIIGPLMNRTVAVHESTPIAYFLISPR